MKPVNKIMNSDFYEFYNAQNVFIKEVQTFLAGYPYLFAPVSKSYKKIQDANVISFCIGENSKSIVGYDPQHPKADWPLHVFMKKDQQQPFRILIDVPHLVLHSKGNGPTTVLLTKHWMIAEILKDKPIPFAREVKRYDITLPELKVSEVIRNWFLVYHIMLEWDGENVRRQHNLLKMVPRPLWIKPEDAIQWEATYQQKKRQFIDALKIDANEMSVADMTELF